MAHPMTLVALVACLGSFGSVVVLVILSLFMLKQSPAHRYCLAKKTRLWRLLVILGVLGILELGACGDIHNPNHPSNSTSNSPNNQPKSQEPSSNAEEDGTLSHLAVNDHDKDGQANEQQAGHVHVVTITPSRVTLADEHIQNFKPERYQPHLTLYGRLIPRTQHLIKAEAGWQLKQISVQPNQWVKKGDVLLTYQTAKQSPDVPPAHPITQKTTDDTTIDDQQSLDDTNGMATSQDPEAHLLATAKTLQNSEKDSKKTDLGTTKEEKSEKEISKKDDDDKSHPTTTPDSAESKVKNSEESNVIDEDKKTSVKPNTETDLKNQQKPSIAPTLPPSNRGFVVGRPPQQKPTDVQTTTKQITPSAVVSELLAPYAGQVTHSYLSYLDKSTPLAQGQPLLKINDTREFHFISVLPEYTRSQISIGQVVNFSPQNTATPIKMTGQVAKIAPIGNNSLAVTITVIEDEKSRPYLKEGLWVQGKVDYGQIEVGTLVAKSAVVGADLSAFLQPHAHVAAPVKAYVWIINQDLTLTRQPVMVVRYDAQTQQYLVSGIPPEVLICVANLPKSAEGKVARVVS